MEMALQNIAVVVEHAAAMVVACYQMAQQMQVVVFLVMVMVLLTEVQEVLHVQQQAMEDLAAVAVTETVPAVVAVDIQAAALHGIILQTAVVAVLITEEQLKLMLLVLIHQATVQLFSHGTYRAV